MIGGTCFILNRKRTRRRHVLPEEKLQKTGPRLKKSTRKSLVRLAQLKGLSATSGRIAPKLLNISQLWFTNYTTQIAE